jgi:hypothetical protein
MPWRLDASQVLSGSDALDIQMFILLLFDEAVNFFSDSRCPVTHTGNRVSLRGVKKWESF